MKILILGVKEKKQKRIREIVAKQEQAEPIFAELKELSFLLAKNPSIEGVIFYATDKENRGFKKIIDAAENIELNNSPDSILPYVILINCIEKNKSIAVNITDNVFRIILGQALADGEKKSDLPEDLVKLGYSGQIAILNYPEEDDRSWRSAIVMLQESLRNTRNLYNN